MNGIEKDYVEIIGGDLVPLYMVMGNSIFAEKNSGKVRLRCILIASNIIRRGKKSLNGILLQEWSIKNGGEL